MFVKMSLYGQLICFADLVGMTLLAVLFLLPPCLPYASSLPPTAPFRLRLPSACGSLHPTVFSESVFPHSLQLSWNSFYHQHPLQFLAQQFPTSQYLHVLQLSRYVYAKMDLLISQKLVQVHWIPVHVFDQHLYRMESLLVLKQPSCNVF